MTTGFELLGQHRDLPCESCHANAIFKGTPKACANCHGVGTTIRATSKPANHILSTDQCDACHTPVAWKPAVNFDHTQVRGSCSSCHNGVQAQGKPPNHIITDLECDACHTTLSWTGAVFTHEGVTGGCAACHNGVNASGLAPSHFPIGSGAAATPCESCHSPTNFSNWLGAQINHPAVATLTCASCHETANYLGMHPSTNTAAGDSRPNATLDPRHPATGDCGQCHDTTTFANSALRPANHIPTSAPCVQCHTTAGNYALYSVSGVHQGVTGCLSCHGPNTGPFAGPPPGNTITIVGWPGNNHIPIGGLDCNGSGCHTTNNVNPGGFRLGSASISSPTLNVTGHTTVAPAAPACQTCHESAPYTGMVAGTATAAGDSRPMAALDSKHPTTGDCGSCHSTSPTFSVNQNSNALPAGHVPIAPPTFAAQPGCGQCHTSAGNYALYSVSAVHQGASGCLACHGPTVATTFLNVTLVTTPANHIPIGSLDCNGSGCHSTGNVNPGGFKIGVANVASPTLNAAGHVTAAAAAPCSTCHETAPYLGMLPSTAPPGADSRPTAFDAKHPLPPGDCGNCHVTTPTFATNLLPTAPKPANHIPTAAVCAQCHTTPGDFSLYSVSGVHQGVSSCLACHGPNTGPFAGPPPGNTITIVGWPGNSHIPIGGLDCNGSGCHTTANVSPGGFRIGAGTAGNIASPTLSVAGHTTLAAGGVSGCVGCHETAPYMGMTPSTASAYGDSRPEAKDPAHPSGGECSGCHSTTPTFATNQSGSAAKPANHIPTSAACAQCHTTAGNYALYSVTGTHQGVTACLSCHGPTVNTTFYNVTPVTTPSNHIPIGSLDCNGSGCHTTANVNAGGFRIGAASFTAPTLTVAGHTTVAGTGGVSGCQTCHATAPYLGMIASTAGAWGDSRPTAYDKNHPASGDCNGCHTTTPTFNTNQSGSAAKPANHIPTSAACAQCHTTVGNYGLYVMGATGHAGITNNCAQCHAYGRSFYNMAPPTLVEPPAGATGHIPAVPPNGTSAIACELCHSPTVFTTFSGTVMKHAYVTAMKCDSCHEYNMQWKTNNGLWTRPSPNHHAGQDCGGSGCHTSRDKYVVRTPQPRVTPATVTPRTGASPAPQAAARNAAPPIRSGAPATRGGVRPLPTTAAATTAATAPFTHAAVAATPCASCHNGASGKPAGHLATSASCQSCHTTLAWLPVTRVDHTQLGGTCVSCHNGQVATGKPSRHLATNATCDACHTTNAWIPARFDHAGVAPHTCTTCHDTVRAIGKPRAHVPTAQSCDTCHGTLAWTPVKVDHSALAAACASCHNNVSAVGVAPEHLLTHVGCDSCHSYPDWSVLHFRHRSAAYPGAHRAALACTSCHTTNTDTVPYASAADAGTCGGCHAKDFKPASHPKTARGIPYGAHELANCSGACHVYSDTTQSTITRSLPGPHHRVTDATFRR
jgi:hypothetical protein